MKKIILLAAACAAASFAPAAEAEGSAEGKPLKVLMIGNSFSICNLKEMPNIAKSEGAPLDLASLFIGGCSFERHWRNVEVAATNANFKPYRFDRNVNGAKAVDDGRANIPDALALDKWDVVTIQQASPLSWQPKTFEPFASNLVALVRRLAPQAKIMVQETWSYPNWDKRLKKFGFDQVEMYRRLHGAYAGLAARYGLEVIPVGTAAEFAPDVPTSTSTARAPTCRGSSSPRSCSASTRASARTVLTGWTRAAPTSSAPRRWTPSRGRVASAAPSAPPTSPAAAPTCSAASRSTTPRGSGRR